MSSNPKYIGPGYWASWHIKGLYTDNEEKKGELARCVAIDIKNFPCLECRNHAKNYVGRNPLMRAVKDSDPLSMFKWTVKFHNEVNIRLNKKTVNFEDAVKMWNGEKICTENCQEPEPEPEPEPESEPVATTLIRGF